MKALKYFGVILSFLCFQQSFAQDPRVIDKEINLIHQKTIENQNNTRFLLRSENQLIQYKTVIHECISKEKETIAKLEKYQNFLVPSSQTSYVSQQREMIVQKTNDHKDALNLCQYVGLKINANLKQINYLNKEIYQRTIFKSYPGLLSCLQRMRTALCDSILPNYSFQKLITNTEALHNIKNILMGLLVLVFLKFLNTQKIFQLKAFQQLQLGKFIFVSLLFFIVAPAPYILVKTQIMHYDDFLVTVFTRPLTNLLNLFFIFYLYIFYAGEISKKDVLWALLTVILKFILIQYVLGMSNIASNTLSSQQMIFYKYLILLILEAQLFLVVYWSIFKILKITHIPHYLVKGLVVLQLSVFVMGLMGYVNFAINLNIDLIVISILFCWLVVVTHLKGFLVKSLENDDNRFLLQLKRSYGLDLRQGGLNLKILIYYTYLIAVLVILLTVLSLSMLSIWIMPYDFIENTYNFIFKEQAFHQLSFKIIKYMNAIFAFFILNTMNKMFSVFLARKLYKDIASVQKSSELIYLAGFIFVLLFSLVIADFQFSSFTLILGGLSFGIGLGLKNLLSSFISCIVLFIERPFEMGDFIAMGEIKGYVKKMTLLETILETPDKTILILPNQFVANSVIENFNYGNKDSHKVHLKYTLVRLTPEDEAKIQQVVMGIIQKENDYIDMNESINVIFAPLEQSSGIYYFEVIFSMSSLKKIKEHINNINRMILDELQTTHLNIKYDSATHPLK